MQEFTPEQVQKIKTLEDSFLQKSSSKLLFDQQLQQSGASIENPERFDELVGLVKGGGYVSGRTPTDDMRYKTYGDNQSVFHGDDIEDLNRLSRIRCGDEWDVSLKTKVCLEYADLALLRNKNAYLKEISGDFDNYFNQLGLTLNEEETTYFKQSLNTEIAESDKNLKLCTKSVQILLDRVEKGLAANSQEISPDELTDPLKGQQESVRDRPGFFDSIAEFFQKVYRELLTGLESALSGKPLDQVKAAYDQPRTQNQPPPPGR